MKLSSIETAFYIHMTFYRTETNTPDIVCYIEKLKKYEFVTILNFVWFWPEICNSCNFGISIWRSKSISYFSLHLVLVLFHELPFLHSISANHYLSTVAVACTHFFYIVQIISCFELKEKVHSYTRSSITLFEN